MGERTLLLRLLAAGFYGFASFMIIVANKVVLTSYKFPSFQVLGLGQMLVGLIVLLIGKQIKVIHFPGLTRDTFQKIWPLPVLYLGNLIFGLGGTKKLSLPMFTVLRRFSIWFTMIAEVYVLGAKPSRTVQFTVFLMIFGAIVAASADLSFDLVGYAFILLNNVFTAANMVYTKKKIDAKDLGMYGLLFYNSLFMIIPAISIALYQDEFNKVKNFPDWFNVWFLLYFGASCIMGFILNYSTVLCTDYNSPLTTTIVGVLKNLLVTYIGMFLGGDYVFNWVNFIGLNISVSGSLLYSYVTFKKPAPPKADVTINIEKPPLTV
ncbi:hypothetical protein ACJMK2_042116 [Sinanodonta woodiana]|uniref:Sugar phosphate transporter domain-containing protein n=1 Tax=Sinanodonta woodiana TaxID=1069815 RepID=A0ABD3W6B7_SINWO